MAATKRPLATPAAYLERIKKLRGDVEKHTGLELAKEAPAKRDVYNEFALHSSGISMLMQSHLNDLRSLSQREFEPIEGTGALRVALARKKETLAREINALKEEERRASEKHVPHSRMFALVARRDPMLLDKSVESHELIFSKARKLLEQHPELREAYEAYLKGKIRLR